MVTEGLAGVFVTFDDLSSLDWPTLETIAGVTFSKSRRRCLLQAFNAYISSDPGVQKQVPSI
jgi:hypothetical protein